MLSPCLMHVTEKNTCLPNTAITHWTTGLGVDIIRNRPDDLESREFLGSRQDTDSMELITNCI